MQTLRFGDAGDDVGLLQRELVKAGFPLDVTNSYDEATKAAVITFQQKTGLAADGIAGPKTYTALAAISNASKRLSTADLERAAQTLDVPIACVQAVNEVESRGTGFLLDGRPVILFERHVFWKRLVAHGIDPAAIAAIDPDILSKTPGGYKGYAAEYPRLLAAERIHSRAARESASWGSFQVMGYHWERLGYASIDDFVERMGKSEAEHLDAFVRYVAADPVLVAALKARDWAEFAKGYNGKNYAKNQYDVKLQRAYERFASGSGTVAEPVSNLAA
jgi:hypothetical protein